MNLKYGFAFEIKCRIKVWHIHFTTADIPESRRSEKKWNK